MTHLPLLRVRCRLTTALTDADLANDVRLLDAQERETCHRFLAREDRRDYAAAHALLRRTLTSLEPATSLTRGASPATRRASPTYLMQTSRVGRFASA
jgi:hypothetical protein